MLGPFFASAFYMIKMLEWIERDLRSNREVGLVKLRCFMKTLSDMDKRFVESYFRSITEETDSKGMRFGFPTQNRFRQWLTQRRCKNRDVRIRV